MEAWMTSNRILRHALDRWAEAKWDLPRSHRQKRRAAGTGNYKMVRYCDDFVVVSNGTLAEAKAVKEELKDFLRTALHLELSKESTPRVNGSSISDRQRKVQSASRRKSKTSRHEVGHGWMSTSN